MKPELWQTIELSLSSVGISDLDQVVILPASALQGKHVPGFPPSIPALILELGACADLTPILRVLEANYSLQHVVKLISVKSMTANIKELPLSELARMELGGALIHLFLPPLEESTAFEAFQEVVARLRAPDGCPWDQKQTHQTLRSHLLSETYEVLSALDEEDIPDMCEEFGDLLLQIVLHAQIASEAGEFQMKDVVQGIYKKIVHRHPHVFGDMRLNDEKGVLQNWERLKAAERAVKSTQNDQPEKPKGMLDGVPMALPALVQAQEYFERVERVGITWMDEKEIIQRIGLLADEIQGRGDQSAMMRLIFLTANLASIHHLDAEALLREANGKVRKQVQTWEDRARTKDVNLATCVSAEEIRSLWSLDHSHQ